MSGKYVRHVKPVEGRVAQFIYTELSDANFDIADAVKAIAADLGKAPAQVALSWLRQKGVVPIIGARTLVQLQENLASLDVLLGGEHMQMLDRVSGVPLGFPHDFLQAKIVRDRMHGGAFERIDRINKSSLGPVLSLPSSIARYRAIGPQGNGRAQTN